MNYLSLRAFSTTASNAARSSATNAAASARIVREAFAGPAALCSATLSAFVIRNANVIRSSFGARSFFGLAALAGLALGVATFFTDFFDGFFLLVGISVAAFCVVSDMAFSFMGAWPGLNGSATFEGVWELTHQALRGIRPTRVGDIGQEDGQSFLERIQRVLIDEVAAEHSASPRTAVGGPSDCDQSFEDVVHADGLHDVSPSTCMSALALRNDPVQFDAYKKELWAIAHRQSRCNFRSFA